MTIIEGVVEHGDARGRELGFPTANLPLTDTNVEDGVWAATIDLGHGEWAVAAVSIGSRRTFYADSGPRLLEAHLLDFRGDLYGKVLRVHLGVHLRGQQAFASASELIDQMHEDVLQTRAWATGAFPWLVRSLKHTDKVEA